MTTKQTTLLNWRKTAGGIHQSGQKETRNANDVNQNKQINNNQQVKPTAVNINNRGNSRLIQQSIDGKNTNTNLDVWGHCMPKKTDGVIRIGLKNINSLPLNPSHSKNDSFINDIVKGVFDIFCATEINIAWKNISNQSQIAERFRGKLEFAKYITSYNNDDQYKEQFQRGGTLTVVLGHICARTVKVGGDTRTLGRWSWTQIRGSKGLILIIATLYRPVVSKEALLTYQQHKSILLEEGISTCPRQNILEEIGEQIRNWVTQGFQIIVTGYFNEDVRGNTIKSFFNQFGMKELIITQHGTNAPNTYLDGSVPIDGIFGTTGIQAVFSGYLAFAWGMYSDHRTLWVDLDTSTILGTKSIPMWKPQARRLQCRDPKLIKKFNKERLKHANTNGFQQKQLTIQNPVKKGETIQQWKHQQEELDNLRHEGIIKAEKRFRKLKMGNTPWSPI
jgi:hypothetical protein